MPSFTYNAMDKAGRAMAGHVEAATRPKAIAQLAEQGLFVTTLNEAAAGGAAGGGAAAAAPSRSSTVDRSSDGVLPRRRSGLFGGRISRRARAGMWSQLATSLEAGLPLLTALRIVEEQAETQAMTDLAGDLADRVRGGESLAEALAAHPKLFSPLHLSMIRAGETAGVLDEVMSSLADFAERDLAIVERVRSAATYPAIVLTLALVSVVVILTFILPNILGAVAEDSVALPWPTRLLMAVSGALRSWAGVGAVVALAGGGWALRSWLQTPEGRLAFDRFKLRVPVLGPTLRKAAVARFARGLGTLTGCGIPILEALEVLRDTLGNAALAQTMDKVRAEITQGEPIAEPLRATGQFPPMFIQVVALGERTGRLDELLIRAADALEKEATAAIERTMTVLPAVLIIVLALIVCLILAAVLLPIVNVQTSMPGM